MDGLSWKEVILSVLLPLVLGAYVYTWMGAHYLWEGLEKLRMEMKADIKELKENDLHDLKERVERLERDR